jgi:hypothetical protein
MSEDVRRICYIYPPSTCDRFHLVTPFSSINFQLPVKNKYQIVSIVLPIRLVEMLQRKPCD